jgi:hypothetical protein
MQTRFDSRQAELMGRLSNPEFLRGPRSGALPPSELTDG